MMKGLFKAIDKFGSLSISLPNKEEVKRMIDFLDLFGMDYTVKKIYKYGEHSGVTLTKKGVNVCKILHPQSTNVFSFDDFIECIDYFNTGDKSK